MPEAPGRKAAQRSRLDPPRALAFDLDGTLVDTVPARILAWSQALEEGKIPSTRAQVAALIGCDGKELARRVAADAGIRLADRRAEALDLRQGAIFSGLNHHPRPLPGVHDLLQRLDALGIPWVIATSSRKEQVGPSVEALGLPHEPRVVDGSDVSRAKPAPDLLLKAARDLGVPPRACWYVGDSTWDMRAAVEAGMVAVAVTAGSAVDARVLGAAGAARVCGTLDDVAKLLPDRVF